MKNIIFQIHTEKSLVGKKPVEIGGYHGLGDLLEWFYSSDFGWDTEGTVVYYVDKRQQTKATDIKADKYYYVQFEYKERRRTSHLLSGRELIEYYHDNCHVINKSFIWDATIVPVTLREDEYLLKMPVLDVANGLILERNFLFEGNNIYDYKNDVNEMGEALISEHPYEMYIVEREIETSVVDII